MSEEVAAINESSNHTNTPETKIEAEREAVNIGIFTGTASGGASSSESEPEKGKETKGKKSWKWYPKRSGSTKIDFSQWKIIRISISTFCIGWKSHRMCLQKLA